MKNPTARAFTTDEVDELAALLVADLTPHAGDPDAVHAVLNTWLDEQDVARLTFVCVAAVRDIFARHLTRLPIDEVPQGSLVLSERNASDDTPRG